MNNIIIGTAGHIDHGKTTLIKALTGVDTDRLKEEKKRGISIDLGFTNFKINSKKIAGIIDVPGHEKFLKNMLAGVAGMDIILLVVSAEEGVMPQTREHLDILNLIGIKKGIIVITKSDKVEKDFLEMVAEDIRSQVKFTFLENADIISVDSISKNGIDELINKIDLMTEELEPKNLDTFGRLFVDRVFSIKGFGSVVTGTLIEGTLKVDDSIFLYPQKIEGRIRGLQVHSQKTDIAYAGQRVAVNLSNITLDEVQRGDILSSNPDIPTAMMLDAKITILNNISKDLEHWDRVRLYHGAREILGRIVPLENETLKRGETGFVQIRLEEEISSKERDHIILRYYSPLETIGGGIILNPNAEKHTSNSLDIINNLKLKEEGSLSDRIIHILEKSKQLMSSDSIKKELSDETSKIDDELKKLVDENQVIHINDLWIEDSVYQKIKLEIEKHLIYYHKKFPFRNGMIKEELRTKLTFKFKPKEFETVLLDFEKGKIIGIEDQLIFKYGFKIIFEGKAKTIKAELERLYINNPSPLQTDKVIENDDTKSEILYYLLNNILVKLDENIIYDKSLIKQYEQIIIKNLKTKNEVTIKDLKDETGLSRKYLIAIMEYFDKVKLTKRSGDTRVAYDSN